MNGKTSILRARNLVVYAAIVLLAPLWGIFSTQKNVRDIDRQKMELLLHRYIF